MNILEKSNFDCVTIDGKELTVVSKLKLRELYQQLPDKQWRESGKESLAFQLANEIWLFKIPMKEAGKYIWLKMKVLEYVSNLGSFYKGDDANFGPARKFAKGNQQTEILYSLYDTEWKITDIGTFSVIGNSEEILINGDRVYFVTSKNEKEWLLYLDARKGEAKGSGGVFRGEEFNPDTDIQSVL